MICLFNFIQPRFHAKPRDTQFEYQQFLQPKRFHCSTRHAACNRYRHFNSSAATYVPLHIGASAEFLKLLCFLLALWSFILVPLGTTKLGIVTWHQSCFDHSLEDNHFESQTRTWTYSDFSWFCSTLSRQCQGIRHSTVHNLATRYPLRLIQNVPDSPNRRTCAAGTKCVAMRCAC